jgi:ABC-type nickel/cobalt efflux system permease component RcnA
MALLVLGPGMNLASLAFLARAYGRRAMLLSIGAFVVVGLAGSVALAWLLPAAPLDLPVLHPLLTHLSALVLLTLLVRSLWQAGPRAWLAVLGDLGGPGTGHDHRHDHSHGHEHGHGHGHLERAPSADLDPIEAAHAGERAHDHAHQHDEDP